MRLAGRLEAYLAAAVVLEDEVGVRGGEQGEGCDHGSKCWPRVNVKKRANFMRRVSMRRGRLPGVASRLRCPAGRQRSSDAWLEVVNENVVAGEMVVQFGRLRRSQRSEQRRRFDLAERRQQLVQALAGSQQPGAHRRLPVAIEQRQPGRRARWPGDRPRPHRRRHFGQQVGGGEDETDPRPGQPEEMVERAQHDQVGRLGACRPAASGSLPASGRSGFHRRSASRRAFSAVLRRRPQPRADAGRRVDVVRVGEQHVGRRGGQRARQGGVLQQARTMAGLRPRLRHAGWRAGRCRRRRRAAAAPAAGGWRPAPRPPAAGWRCRNTSAAAASRPSSPAGRSCQAVGGSGGTGQPSGLPVADRSSWVGRTAMLASGVIV